MHWKSIAETQQRRMLHYRRLSTVQFNIILILSLLIAALLLTRCTIPLGDQKSSERVEFRESQLNPGRTRPNEKGSSRETTQESSHAKSGPGIPLPRPNPSRDFLTNQ